eukprot:13744180-Ditylum_brightwellii.AAC.1
MGMLDAFHDKIADDAKQKKELELYQRDLETDVDSLQQEEITYKGQKGKSMGERKMHESYLKKTYRSHGQSCIQAQN